MANPETPDILHPSSLLEWEEHHSLDLPVGMCDAQAVFLDGTLHIGGGVSPWSEHNAVLYSSKLVGDNLWTISSTPTSRYALTTYDSHLLLVGGKEYPSGQITKKVYTMIDREFKELHPPMNEKRESPSAVASGSVLVVAGGVGDAFNDLSSVEVYKDGHWSYRHSLPDACFAMKSTVYGDRWILMGGELQETKVFCGFLQSLVSGTEQSPWETLPDVPFIYSATAVVNGCILSIGGENYVEPTSSIHAYSPGTQSWKRLGDLPAPIYYVCAIVLERELVVFGELEEFQCLKMFRTFIRDRTYKWSNDDSLVMQEALESENDYLKDEVKQLESSLSTKDRIEEDVHGNQTLLSEVGSLHSQLALPAPLKTETQFNLPGVEVVGQTSVMVTNSKLSFHWTGYGFKLHIPQGSLPAGVNQCLLHISASTAGEYRFPDNMELVSAVYWVRCEPFCRFQQPLTAELQHCAKMTSSTNLTFVRAVCSQQDLPYTFKKLEGCGSFTDQSSYGSLQLNQFSGFAIAGENVERLYIASLYYLIEGLYTCAREIFFVITWADDTHTNRVKQFFEEEKGAKERVCMGVEFKEKSISLDIPMRDGVSVDEWKLFTLFSPHLPQWRVDSFKPGKCRVPFLHLKATLPDDRKEPVPRRSYVVTLQGAREPYNEMVIEIDPFKYRDDQIFAESTKQLMSIPAPPALSFSGQFKSGPFPSAVVPYRDSSDGPSLAVCLSESASNGLRVNEMLKQVDNTYILDVNDDIKDVLDYLEEVAHSWETIAHSLRVKESKITELSRSNRTPQSCLAQVITEWLKLNYNHQRFGKPTWRKVAESVAKLDTRLFQRIAMEHKDKALYQLYIQPDAHYPDQSTSSRSLKEESVTHY